MRAAQATLKEWQKYADHCSIATFFQTPLWYDIWFKTFGVDYNCLKVSIDGTEVLYPYLLRSHNQIYNYCGENPGYTYNLPMTLSAPPAETYDAFFKWLFGSFRVIKFAESPFMPELKFFDTSDLPFQKMATHYIRLSELGSPVEKHWQRLRKRELKEAAASLTVREGSELKDWSDYDNLYRENVTRWEVPNVIYPRELFRNLYEADDPRIRLLLACKGDKVVGGMILLMQGGIANNWLTVTGKAGLETGAATLLNHYAIRVLKDEGKEIYDLNPSSGKEGIERFKEGFKPVLRKEIACISHNAGALNQLHNVYQKIRRIF